MWNQKPLSSPGGSPKLGGQQQRSNPFASSRPLAGTAAAATAAAPPPAGLHRSDQPPPQHPGWANTSQPATGPGPPPTAAYAPRAQGSVHAAGAPTPPTASPQRAFYPTPPEMHPQGGTGSSPMMTGHEGGGYGAMGPMAGGGIPQPSQQQAYRQHQQAYQQHQPHQPRQPAAFGLGVPAPHPNATAPQPGLFTPQTADASLGPPTANATTHAPPLPFVPPSFGTPGSGGRSSPSNTGKPMHPSSSGVAGASGPAGLGPVVGAPPISLRGREKYCSGGAWVGPAPEWPKPPADATIANADVSRVRPRHARIVSTLREKFEAVYAASAGARKKELDGISTKIGGMFVFLNEGEGETHISGPVADSLAALCDAMRAGDAATVNAHLLHVSTHHWEEAAYWFPSLKRLVKL
uniref:Uncharacterized protein n=1 Tax=Micromonas pusilla TaxID=38833 RepID=A0A7S0KB69_MICPS|mmetsp:Transcript_10564/g.41249  ORF Transcript_10564/g.41249 Transcript_10564/m.41249 type:complete len:408 (+) Transcript_10564:274-1497(+)